MKTIKVTEENFSDLITGLKKFEVRSVSDTSILNIKNGDTICIEEYNVSEERTYRFAIAKIGVIEQYDNLLILSLTLIEYVDEKGIVHLLKTII